MFRAYSSQIEVVRKCHFDYACPATKGSVEGLKELGFRRKSKGEENHFTRELENCYNDLVCIELAGAPQYGSTP